MAVPVLSAEDPQWLETNTLRATPSGLPGAGGISPDEILSRRSEVPRKFSKVAVDLDPGDIIPLDHLAGSCGMSRGNLDGRSLIL